jgi:hypothetical protein
MVLVARIVVFSSNRLAKDVQLSDLRHTFLRNLKKIPQNMPG